MVHFDLIHNELQIDGRHQSNQISSEKQQKLLSKKK